MDYLPVLDAIKRGKTTAAASETDRLEFKTGTPASKETHQDLAEAAVCLANGVGGTIVVGVKDRVTGEAAFEGFALDPLTLRSRIHALTSPSLAVSVESFTYDGVELCAIVVDEGLDVYSTVKGSHTWRLGHECLPMKPFEVARLAEERRGVDWSGQVSSRHWSDVNLVVVGLASTLLRGSPDPTRQALSRLSPEELLQELSLLDKSGNLLNAGVLLFCRPVDGDHSDLLVYQHRKTRSGEADFVRRWQSPMLQAYVEALDIVSARISSVPVTTRSGVQVTLEEFPASAIREALANALIHGDPRERRPVQVEHSPDLLAIISPGPLVSGITPSNILTHGSKPRFPLLARVMRTFGLAEELGQGVDRMFREMIRSGRDAPSVRVTHDEPAETVIELLGGPPNVRLAKFVAELPDAEQADTDALLITLMLCEKRTLTARDVAAVIQRPVDQAERVLRRLSSGDGQFIEPTAGTAARRNPNYRLRGTALASLGNAVSYSRRNPSETENKIVDHIREYGTVNSAAVQRMFDVDVYQAREVLSDLIGRELLVRVSEQRRGTAVKYGPGPKFPAKNPARRPSKNAADDGRLF